MIDSEVIIVPTVFALPCIVIFARMWFRHKEKMITLKGSGSNNAALESRLARIEEAVDTIAVEIERMGEGQRFVTKLLSERSAQLPEATRGTGSSGRVTTPH
jgi:hypothetical protein